uniref:phage portal protein n=1 Tax=Providencia rustigianii TaxID=158850 RepID=UPI00018450FC
MSRKNKKRHSQNMAHTTNDASMEAFTFGDPIPVLDKREIFDYLECVQIDNYYEPPISFHGLARTFRAAPHHSSAIYVKRNILTSTFIPNKYLSRQTFDSWGLDFLLFGNGYLELRENRLGQALTFKHSPAKFTRRGADLETYWFVQHGYDTKPYEFETGKVHHLIEPDINQEIYGLPEYLAAIPS